MSEPLSFAVELAQQAGKLLLDYFQHSGIHASRKADQTVVTEADLAADALIAKAIHKQYAGEGIISEELQPIYVENHPAVWVVDPLDGTTNFSLGFPFWGVSIARVVEGRPQQAALFFPTIGELYSAEKGKGAFLNDRRLSTAPEHDERQSTFFSCCSRTHRRYRVSIPYKPRIVGSAAYNLCAVARGISLIGFEATPKIWDIAAGWLMIQEAGGLAEPFSGPAPFPLQAGMDYGKQNFPTLMAANPAAMEQARRSITPR